MTCCAPTYGSKGGDGNADPTTWGNAAGRVKIASGLEQAAFPAIGTSGDVTGDKLADLWPSAPAGSSPPSPEPAPPSR
ncbi:hypothetical protein ACFXGI_12645 [Streptomyces sp. NPDC059355]|uniref:hypothetical protein n=1 Tax=Streptomyces sp. NPDC059355 TaxID=3346811 RepID=UPI00367D4554